jgi:menaquinone reductase, multiheme cytochrome c subunit
MTARTSAFVVTGILLGGILGWIIFPLALYSSEPQPVSFSHYVHTGAGAGLTCDVCHGFDAEGRFLGIPDVHKCAECHSSAIGTTPSEAALIATYVTPDREIPWHTYNRLPDNAYFSHAAHVRQAGLACSDCHGTHGTSDSLQSYDENRITGESRDVWGRENIDFTGTASTGKKMDRCVRCHAEHDHAGGCVECHK